MLNMHYQCGKCGMRMSVEPHQPAQSLRCPHCQAEMAPAVAVTEAGNDPDMFEFGVTRDEEEDSIFGSQTAPNDPFAETTPVVEIPAAKETRPVFPPQPPAWTVLPPLPARTRRRRTLPATYLLIILVPYSILMTAIVLYLLSTRQF